MSVTTPLYEPVPDWERLPAGYVHRDVSDVAVGTGDRVYLVTRMDARVLVYEPDGTFITAWGEDVLSEGAHGITVGPDDAVYVVDQFDHVVRKFTPDGDPLLVIGTPGVASETGTEWGISDHLERTRRTAGGPPFNNPTNLAVAPSGELYVSDGYCNARIHRFSADGALLGSWGAPGSGDGEFRIPHDVTLDERGRVLVADRENDRIQLFTPEGEHLETWPAQKPCAIEVHDGAIYVAETRVGAGSYSFRRGTVDELEWARVSVYDHDGAVITRIGGGREWPADAVLPGNITSAHGLAVDSHGDVYVAETTYTSAGRRGLVPEDCHTIQKFRVIR